MQSSENTRQKTHVTPSNCPRWQDGWTALIMSAQNGHVEVARLLLESKADIHAATQVPQAKPANLPMLRLKLFCFAFNLVFTRFAMLDSG